MSELPDQAHPQAAQPAQASFDHMLRSDGAVALHVSGSVNDTVQLLVLASPSDANPRPDLATPPPKPGPQLGNERPAARAPFTIRHESSSRGPNDRRHLPQELCQHEDHEGTQNQHEPDAPPERRPA